MEILIFSAITLSLFIIYRAYLWFQNVIIERRKYKKLKLQLDLLEDREKQLWIDYDNNQMRLVSKESQLLAEHNKRLESFEVQKKELRVEQDRNWEQLRIKEAQLLLKYNERFESLQSKEITLLQKQRDWEKKVEVDKQDLEKLAQQYQNGFPMLAEAYAEYSYLKNLQIANYLESKSQPAIKAAEQVREIAAKLKVSEKLCKVLNYQ